MKAVDFPLVHAATRGEWRKWLAENHDLAKPGIWLVFEKIGRRRGSLSYEEAVEEALCFGWIDSIVKRMDSDRYCRKFNPRKPSSRWSSANRRRVEKLIGEGKMTAYGLAKVDAAKKLGHWQTGSGPVLPLEMPDELFAGLARDGKAKEFFAQLPRTYRNQFIGWIVSAKRPETRARRVRESLLLLGRGEKLGLR